MLTVRNSPSLWVGITGILALCWLMVVPDSSGSVMSRWGVALWLVGFVPVGSALWALVQRRSTMWFGSATRSGLALLIALGLFLGTTGLTIGSSAAPPRLVTATPSPPAPSDSPTPTSTPTPTPTPTPQSVASALVLSLEVKDQAPAVGYDRAQFGQAWADADRNGCDTRNDILRRDLAGLVTKPGTNGCVAAKGTLQDPYGGSSLAFTGNDGDIEIDHVVSLVDAWQKGAQGWDADRRVRFANDPLNLVTVSPAFKAQKGDGDAAAWLPGDAAGRCTYVVRQAQVKRVYGLSLTAAEQQAMLTVLAGCPDQAILTSADVPAPLPDPVPTASVVPTPVTVVAAPSSKPTAPAPAPTTSKPTATTTAPKAPAATGTVWPGSFCAKSMAGQLGRTAKGTLMRCTTTSTDDRLRWRAA